MPMSRRTSRSVKLQRQVVRSADRNQVVRGLYGDYLYDRRDFYDAALCESSHTQAAWSDEVLLTDGSIQAGRQVGQGA